MNSFESGWKMLDPVMSLGNKSAVNWIREKCPDTLLAMALPISVLPTPGTSSNRACSPASKATMHSRTTSGLPNTTWETLFSSSPTRLKSSVAIEDSGPIWWVTLCLFPQVYPSPARFPRSSAVAGRRRTARRRGAFGSEGD